MTGVDRVLTVGQWAEVAVSAGCMDQVRKHFTLKYYDKAPTAQAKVPHIFTEYRTHEDPTKLFVPRAGLDNYTVPVVGKWEPLRQASRLVPRDNQATIVETFMTGLKHRPYGGILSAATGVGKTAMSIDIACRLGLKTLIVVPRTTLVSQWAAQLVKWTGVSKSKIGLIQGPTIDVEGKAFVIAMLHTLSQQWKDFDDRLTSMFGTVIFDETHTLPATTFRFVAPLFKAQTRIGLSATPTRADGMEQLLFWHIGPVLVRYTKLQAKPKVRIVPYTLFDTSHKGCVFRGKLILGRYLNRVVASQGRLQLVAKLIRSLDAKDEDILVLADRIGYLERIREVLIAKGVCPDKIGMLTGTVKQLDKKIILGTYGAAGMGVDIPRLSALVLATPRSDIVQAVGRVLRQGTPIIIDVVDDFSSIMVAWYRRRMEYYAKITNDIKRIDV